MISSRINLHPNFCPNTYIYTKRVAESVFNKYGKGLPVVIVRPSVITASNKEPVPGWIYMVQFICLTGVLIGNETGVLRSMECNPHAIADIIPVDMVPNTVIASAWNLDCRRKDSIEHPLIYNIVSSAQNPITWFNISAYTNSSIIVENDKIKLSIFKFFLHYLPALLIDTIAPIFGKEKRLLKVSEKVDKLLQSISFFCIRQWDLSNNNTQDLWKSLDQKDKEIFPFNIEDINGKNIYMTI
ncbi:fatty acyl-CoA reductase wat-like isoform X2 [Lycorma delicatula]|uniref:fatty acyl-CoA reductase wat-like isoform X2 n=1 Tax=Lycorma delicatula TaxID=130591 RepID=UPI003F5192F3